MNKLSIRRVVRSLGYVLPATGQSQWVLGSFHDDLTFHIDACQSLLWSFFSPLDNISAPGKSGLDLVNIYINVYKINT